MNGFAPLEYDSHGEDSVRYRRARQQLVLWRCLTYSMLFALIGEALGRTATHLNLTLPVSSVHIRSCS